MERAELEATYSTWSTERLVNGAVVCPEEYNPDAVASMRQVLERRGVSPQEIDAIASTMRRGNGTRRPLSSIAGWLLAFIVWSAMSSAVGLVTGLVMLVGSDHVARTIAAGLWIAASAYGGFCASRLAKRAPEAPLHARRWLLALAATGALATVVEYSLRGEVLSGAARPILFAAGWLTYLTRSRRVACVYQGRCPELD